MKPAIYYTLCRPNYSRNYTVLAVTSEGPRGRINGRWEDGYPTHVTSRDCRGRFETAEPATARIARIEMIQKKYDELRKPLDRQIQALHSTEENEIKEALA